MQRDIWLGIITSAAALGAAVLGACIPLLVKRHMARLKTKRIRRPGPDLVSALRLYQDRLKDIDHDDPNDICRWISEVRQETKEGSCKLEDYLLVAKLEGQVEGLLYAHYYIHNKYLFISYVAASKGAAPCISSELCCWLLKRMRSTLRGGSLRDCTGIVFELERPTLGKHFARERLFRRLGSVLCGGVKEILIDYRQPSLSLGSVADGERSYKLMYGRTVPPPLRDTLPREEVKKILGFVYGQIYGDHFEDSSSDCSEYRLYLSKLYEAAVRVLPDSVKLAELA